MVESATMVDQLSSVNSDNPAQKLEALKAGETYLASSSEYRARELTTTGFLNVHISPVPNEVEVAVIERLQKSAGGSFSDPYYTEIPRLVARRKVEYLLEQGSLPDDALGCAFDTMPMLFHYNESNAGTSTMWSAAHSPKPETGLEARAVIKASFKHLMMADGRYRQVTGHHSGLSEAGIQLLEYGYLPRLIRVNTGMAVRLPNTANIQTSSSYTNLSLDKLFEINSKAELEQLVNEVIIIMAINDDLLNTAGGIDFANEDIRQLLKVREVTLPGLEPEVGVYKGLPAQAFERFLVSMYE
jgi:hypothetical protein